VTPFFGGETLFFLPAGFGGACPLRSGFSGALKKRYLNIGHDKNFISQAIGEILREIKYSV